MGAVKVRGTGVRVQRVVMPVTGVESWTVVGDDGAVVAPVERYLAYLSALERSPNTVRAYAASLRLWFEFLGQAGVGWADAGVEDVARFVAWLRAPAENVIVLETGTGRRSPATVNRHLAGVFGFYDHHARSGAGVAGELVAWRRVSRGSYKPFLHHVTRGKADPDQAGEAGRDPPGAAGPGRRPGSCDPGRVRASAGPVPAGAAGRDRDACWPVSGLRHCDFVSRRREIRIVARPDNANGARAKLREAAVIPVSTPLVRLYSEYIAEYGELDSDYVGSSTSSAGGSGSRCATWRCISWSPSSPRAPGSPSPRTCCVTPMPPSWSAVACRSRSPARLLTHRSSTTTSQTYIHLGATDVREALTRAGVWDETGSTR